MMLSPYPLEHELGMRYYASETPGIGGILRAAPEDFVVEEIPLPPGGSGPYLICRLDKQRWELQRAVKEIARQLGISHRRIAWAGTKDKNAVTSQLISLYDVPPEAIGRVTLKDLQLTVVGNANAPLTLGSLEGNRFDIVIRDCREEDLAGRVLSVSATVAEAVPNYYGLQRFGVARPITHQAGEQILRGDYEAALAVYVGLAYPGEPEHVRAARQSFYETRNAREALDALPLPMSYERSMLHHLVSHPGDYEGALHVLPPKLLSLLVSAFQSYLFNSVLSLRFEEGMTLSEPEIGDRLIFANGREDVVTERNRPVAIQHLTRKRCRIALFIPGSEPVTAHGPMDAAMQRLMEERGIDAGAFSRASVFVKTKFSGALRPISLSTSVNAAVEGRNVRLMFTLPPGHYATTVCREYMKADPLQMV